MNQKTINEKLSQGHIQLRAIIEIVGKPKEYVEESIKGWLKKIKEDKSFDILKETIEPAIEQEGFFSSFAELELLVKNFDSLVKFCFDYMPSSIEIIAPETIMMKNAIVSNMFNDLQTKLHALNTSLIQETENRSFHVRNTAVLLRNFVVVLLSSKPLSLKQLQSLMGVKAEDIEKVLGVLQNEGKVKKEGDLFKAVSKK